MSATTVPSSAPKVGAADVAFFTRLVDRRIGVQLDGKDYLIASRLQPVARTLGLDDVAALIERVRRGDRAATEAAVEAMTTNETSFFRDRHPFEVLATHVLPDLLDAVRPGAFQVWNGATSSGQESYSLAITLHEHFPQWAVPGRTRILSTDVSAEMVERTRAGSYSRFEVNRGLPTDVAMRHFDQRGRSWVAKPHLQRLVETRTLNLLEPWVRVPRSDLVLLRNVLIYFTREVKRDILRRVRTEVLAPHGCLVLGASESVRDVDPAWESRRINGSTFHFPT